MGVDVNSIPFGQASALLILVFLVQTIRDATGIQGNYIPALTIVVAVPMMFFAALVPERFVSPLALALALAAAGSVMVRYVKSGPDAPEQNGAADEPKPLVVQGPYLDAQGDHQTESPPETSHNAGGQAGVRDREESGRTTYRHKDQPSGDNRSG